MKKTAIILSVAIILLFTIVYAVMHVTYTNAEIRLRNQIEAKIDDSQSHYTKMFEVLVNQAGVARQYANDFKEIYPQLIAGRYGSDGNMLMKWIQESNPNFDTALYSKLMTSIEAQRESFHNNQRQLIDLSREHQNKLKTFPSRHFLSGIEEIDIPVIINNETEEVFKTRREVNMNLFE
jgi:hypothetical protein